MTRIPGSFVALALAALVSLAAARAQEVVPPSKKGAIQTSADVTVVEVPVYVVGKDGRPVRGLTKADFELYDEGERVPGFDLDVIDLEDFSRSTVTPDVSLPPAAQRHFLFLFDLTFAQPINVARARHAAVDFVQDTMKNGDLGSVATIDVEKGLKLVLSFTADRDQLVAAISTLSLPTLTSATADPLALTVFDPSAAAAVAGVPAGQSLQGSTVDSEWASILATAMRSQERAFDNYTQGRVEAMAKELGQLARMLGSIHGRKNVVLFSEGFDSKLLSGVTGEGSGRTVGDQIVFGEHWKVQTENQFGRSDLRSALEEMYQTFKRSDCVIFPLDISGLAAQRTASVEGSTSWDRTSSTDRLGSRGRGRDSLFAFAAETGGQLFQNSNDLGEHLEKLQEELALVYLVSFTPSRPVEPGRFHSLKVKVKASGAQVSFRAGYYEPRPWSKMSPAERRLLAAQKIAYDLPRSDIPARALALPLLESGRDGARVPVILEIPGEPLVKQLEGLKSANLEIYAYAMDQKARVKGMITQSLGLDLARVGPQLSASGLKFYGEMFLPPGTFWLKVLVRVSETGRSGVLIVPISVPPGDAHPLFAVGPVFHEPPGRWLMVKAVPRANAAPAGPYPFVSKGDSFIPAADPLLDTGAEARMSLFVYNAPDGADLELRGEVRGKNGARVGPAAITRLASSREAGGPLELLCSFRPEQLGKGSYTLWVGVKERASAAPGTEAEAIGFFQVR